MAKPRIWKMLGVWYCGQQITARLPRAPIFGSGSSPVEAYSDWVRTKWRAARFMVKMQMASQDDPATTTVAPAVDENRLRIQSQKALIDITAGNHAVWVGKERNIIQRAWDAIRHWGGGK